MVLYPRINRGFRIERIQFSSDMLVRSLQSSSNLKVVTPKSLFFLFPSEDCICVHVSLNMIREAIPRHAYSHNVFIYLV